MKSLGSDVLADRFPEENLTLNDVLEPLEVGMISSECDDDVIVDLVLAGDVLNSLIVR